MEAFSEGDDLQWGEYFLMNMDEPTEDGALLIQCMQISQEDYQVL